MIQAAVQVNLDHLLVAGMLKEIVDLKFLLQTKCRI